MSDTPVLHKLSNVTDRMNLDVRYVSPLDLVVSYSDSDTPALQKLFNADTPALQILSSTDSEVRCSKLQNLFLIYPNVRYPSPSQRPVSY